jgi:hypothetical protein
MTNIYISEGTRDDMHNDCMVILEVKTAIVDAVQRLQTLTQSSAMAYNDNLLPSLVDTLDSLLANDIQSVEQSLTAADQHFYELEKETA